ncbi:MAG: T9SS type A sorting domain-containing protein [Lacibacter sp.]
MKSLLLAIVLVVSVSLQAQVTLTTSPYTENFNNLGTAGLPTGFLIKWSATSTSLGNDSTFQLKTVKWTDFNRGFKNFASSTTVTDHAATDVTQAASTDRALGVRQTSSSGWDPGASFVFRIANTSGKYNFKLNFKLQSLDDTSRRVTTWIVDYGTGATPTSFTTVTTSPATLTTGGYGIFSNTSVSIDFGSALDDKTGDVWIRLWASTGSINSGNRASTAIDDWSLSWDLAAGTNDIIRDENYIKLAGNLKSGLNVTFNKTIPGALKMQLVNMNGQVLWQKQMSKAIQGNVESVIPAKTVTSGVYMLTISSKEGTYTRKIAVQ